MVLQLNIQKQEKEEYINLKRRNQMLTPDDITNIKKLVQEEIDLAGNQIITICKRNMIQAQGPVNENCETLWLMVKTIRQILMDKNLVTDKEFDKILEETKKDFDNSKKKIIEQFQKDVKSKAFKEKLKL
jgi:hypothetical protein